jgi:predicted ArsR family transcriptional regulator
VTGVRGGAGGSPDSLRALNRSKIIAALHRLRAASRADLSQATGLSRGTVASIVTELQHEGIVRSGERDDLVGAAPGRPPTLLRLAPPTGLAVAVDVGHTHVRVAIGDA